MELAPYVHDLQRHLAVAAEAGGDDTREVAERLTAPLEAATRLVLLEALSQLRGEITRELAPGSVDVRLRGKDPEFVVAAPSARLRGCRRTTTKVTVPEADVDDASTSRTTLRLPDQLKARVDEAAAADGISVNAWLVRAIATALEPQEPPNCAARIARFRPIHRVGALTPGRNQTPDNHAAARPTRGTIRHASSCPKGAPSCTDIRPPRTPIRSSFVALQAARLELLASDRADTVVTLSRAIRHARATSTPLKQTTVEAGRRHAHARAAEALEHPSARPTRSS